MANNDLTPQQYRVYMEHGEALASYKLNVVALAERLGVTEWTVRQAQAYAREHGPPEEDARVWRIVVLPDAHFCPHHGGLERAALFGKEIEAQGRLAIANKELFGLVCIGDWHDYLSLSSYEKTKPGIVAAQDVLADIDAGNDAIDMMMAEVSDEVTASLVGRKKTVRGNHEHRRNRYVAENPGMASLLAAHPEGWEGHGFDVYEYQVPAYMADIAFCHNFCKPNTPRPIGGVFAAKSIVQTTHRSSVAGHNHFFMTHTEHRLGGRRLVGTTVGCGFEHNHDYSGQSNERHDRGMCILTNVRDGEYDPVFRRFDALWRDHGR